MLAVLSFKGVFRRGNNPPVLPGEENEQSKKVKFIVIREFSGDKTMREAFEQLIERQTCEHFEEWLERKAS